VREGAINNAKSDSWTRITAFEINELDAAARPHREEGKPGRSSGTKKPALSASCKLINLEVNN
jgi:hypothetical protein